MSKDTPTPAQRIEVALDKADHYVEYDVHGNDAGSIIVANDDARKAVKELTAERDSYRALLDNIHDNTKHWESSTIGQLQFSVKIVHILTGKDATS